jgi:hypothetical protein
MLDSLDRHSATKNEAGIITAKKLWRSFSQFDIFAEFREGIHPLHSGFVGQMDWH